MGPVYEFYRGGRRVERVAPVAGDIEDLRIGGLVLDREAAGARDGWYLDGTYKPEPPAPAVDDTEPVEPATTRRKRAPATEE